MTVKMLLTKQEKRPVKSANAFDVGDVENTKQKEVKYILGALKKHASHISENDIAKLKTHFA